MISMAHANSAVWESWIPTLPASVQNRIRVREPLARHTTLRVGGPADYFLEAIDLEDLASVALTAQRYQLPYHLLGDGSNVCVSDAGIRGFVVRNACRHASIGPETYVATGHSFMELFLRTMQAGYAGLEWAVGIPGTVGGALVSNAGAYGGEIHTLVTQIEIIEAGQRLWVGPEWMEFSYRDSRLRRDGARPASLLAVKLRLEPGIQSQIRHKAKDIQMQRLLKQPWEPSAGSFFKNFHDRRMVEALPDLPDHLKKRGVVTAAYLIESAGCKGISFGGAAISSRHANFMVNQGHATAAEIRSLANHVQSVVYDRFGVHLEEEVLYLGDWDDFHPHAIHT